MNIALTMVKKDIEETLESEPKIACLRSCADYLDLRAFPRRGGAAALRTELERAHRSRPAAALNGSDLVLEPTEHRMWVAKEEQKQVKSSRRVSEREDRA
jgi:hypothetical protein